MNLPPIDPSTVGLCAQALRAQDLTVVDPEPIVEHVDARFDFPDRQFDDLGFFQASHKIVRAASLPLELPMKPAADRVGIDFLRIDMANPRMTTTASMTWAKFASRNVVDTTRRQCAQFVDRTDFRLQPQQLQVCTGRGFVLIRHRGHGLGIGFLESTRRADDNFASVRSMYPGAFSDELQSTSPFGNPR